MKKKIIAFTLTMALLTGAAGVNAAQDINGSFSVDGKEITAVSNGMICVREAAEALGFKVEWIAESKTITLTKGAVYITFTIGEDGYTFARTAPMPLGAAPEIKNGKTYVPVELFTELMQLTASADENGINIITVNELTGNATVTSVSSGTITVKDKEIGEVVLHISKNTKITDADGNAVKAEDITEDSELEVVYGDAMTQSLPPQNNPKSIVVITKAEDNAEDNAIIDTLSITGSVTAIENGMIIVESDEDSNNTVALKITDNTNGNTDVKKGDKVTAAYSPIMTRSIPPQSECFEINLN